MVSTFREHGIGAFCRKRNKSVSSRYTIPQYKPDTIDIFSLLGKGYLYDIIRIKI